MCRTHPASFPPSANLLLHLMQFIHYGVTAVPELSGVSHIPLAKSQKHAKAKPYIFLFMAINSKDEFWICVCVYIPLLCRPS